MERQFNQNGLDWAGYDPSVLSGWRISDGVFRERKRWKESNIKVLPHFQVGHNTEVEPRASHRFSARKRVISDKIFGMINAIITRIIAQGNPEIIVFLLKILIIQVFTLIKLSRCIEVQKADEQSAKGNFATKRFAQGAISLYFVAVYMEHIPSVKRSHNGF